MKLLQVFIPGKVDEYRNADLLIVRKDIISELRLTEGTHVLKNDSYQSRHDANNIN